MVLKNFEYFRIIDAESEAIGLFEPPYVVDGYGYRYFAGSFQPFILVKGFDSVNLVYLYGHHYFVFSGRFCRWCGSPLDDFSRLGLCSSCYFSSRATGYRAIVEGCFGDQVSLPDYKYVVYLASFGDLVKVGVTRFDRGDFGGGFLFRLLEQGAGWFGVLDGGWGLCSAQDVESLLVEEFGFVDKVSFGDKLDLFYDDELSKREFEGVLSDVLGFLRDTKLVSFGSFRWFLPSYDFVWGGDVLSGRVAGFRGNVVVFEGDSGFFAVDLGSLVNRGVVSGEV